MMTMPKNLQLPWLCGQNIPLISTITYWKKRTKPTGQGRWPFKNIFFMDAFPYSQKVLWISWNLEGSRTLLISHNACDNQGVLIVGYFKRENATGSCPATLWVTRADRRKKVCCLVSGPTLAKLFEREPAENAFNRLAHRGGLIFFSNLWNLYM